MPTHPPRLCAVAPTTGPPMLGAPALQLVVPTPAERTLRVAAEARATTVDAEVRTLVVPAENRTLSVAA